MPVDLTHSDSQSPLARFKRLVSDDKNGEPASVADSSTAELYNSDLRFSVETDSSVDDTRPIKTAQNEDASIPNGQTNWDTPTTYIIDQKEIKTRPIPVKVPQTGVIPREPVAEKKHQPQQSARKHTKKPREKSSSPKMNWRNFWGCLGKSSGDRLIFTGYRWIVSGVDFFLPVLPDSSNITGY